MYECYLFPTNLVSQGHNYVRGNFLFPLVVSISKELAGLLASLLPCWESKNTHHMLITSSCCYQTEACAWSAGPLLRASTQSYPGGALINHFEVLYLKAETFLGSNPDQSERYACEQSLNSSDLAAQDKTTCILALLPGISWVHLGPIL